MDLKFYIDFIDYSNSTKYVLSIICLMGFALYLLTILLLLILTKTKYITSFNTYFFNTSPSSMDDTVIISIVHMRKLRHRLSSEN